MNASDFPNRIDTPGSYRAIVLESAVGVTKTGKLQWVGKLGATEKWVDDKESMDFFGLTEPAWVPWQDNQENIVAFLCLFGANVEQGEACISEGPDRNDYLNYEQLQKALGWDGQAFDTLQDDSFLGKEVLFRCNDDEYEGKASIKVQWVDEKDAPIQRELKKLDDAKLKSLNGLLKGKPAAPAKPASKPAAAKPAAGKPGKAAPAATPAAAAPAAKAKPKPPTTKAPAAKAPEPAPEAEENAEASDLPKECGKDDAWNHLLGVKGDTDDSTLAEAWMASCGEVTEGRDEDAFTPKDWAKVRDIVIKDLALNLA